MKRHLIASLAVLAPLSAAHAQLEVPFPMDVVGTDSVSGAPRIAPVENAVRALAGSPSNHVVMTSVPLADGRLVDLTLRRLRPERLGFTFVVDHVEVPNPAAGSSLSIWRGGVVGDPESDVLVTLSLHGSHGWIRTNGEVFHILGAPDSTGSWSGAGGLLVTERTFKSLIEPTEPEWTELDHPAGAPTPPSRSAPLSTLGGATCGVFECPVAVETNFELYQRFNNDLTAETVYVTSLMTAVSDAFEAQGNTVLTFPHVAFYTSINDYWDATFCSSAVVEMQELFQDNLPADATLCHMLSGASSQCVSWWPDVLCDPTFAFSATSGVDGGVTFPTVPSAMNWDYYGAALGLGHNFGARPTHEYCPPIDNCAMVADYGPCQTTHSCNAGTLMSFCGFCGSGYVNIIPGFHPIVGADLAAHAEQCLERFEDLRLVSTPSILDPGVPTPIVVDVRGTPVGTPELLHRPPGGSFQTVPMANMGGTVWSADLPAMSCGDLVEYYVQFKDATCGLVTRPIDAPTDLLRAHAINLTETFADDFETDQGWTTQFLGALTGEWERGIPTVDSANGYEVLEDADGSGQCYVTENRGSNGDVDDGAVRLISPEWDISDGFGRVRYKYWFGLSEEPAGDFFNVEASPNGAQGPWYFLRQYLDGELVWKQEEISIFDLVEVGFPLGGTLQLRFTVRDGDPQSIVEGGLDDVHVEVGACALGLGHSFCEQIGPEALAVEGSPFIDDRSVVLEATGFPAGRPVLFLASPMVSTPSALYRSRAVPCLGTPTLRLGAGPVLASTGAATLDLFAGAQPKISSLFGPGDTWYFQACSNDSVANSGVLYTSGAAVTFR